jgi:hypothetical protein
MKKIINITLIFLMIFAIYNLKSSQKLENVSAKEKGIWILADRIVEDKSSLNDVINLTLNGVEGKLITTAEYKSGLSKEYTRFDWNWDLLPIKLIPGNKIQMNFTGEIKEWKANYALAGVLTSRFTKLDASCCEPTGIDIGFISLDIVKGDIEGNKKIDTSSAIVPEFGVLNSDTSKKIQIRVTLNHGGRYDWVYVYQWVPENKIKKTDIALQIGSNKAILNGKTINLDSQPVIIDSRTFVPFRFIGEALGAEVKYEVDPTTKRVKSVTFEKKFRKIQLFINVKKIIVNGKESEIDVSPKIINNRTMIPVRIISEAFSADVSWDGKNQKINIHYEE